MKKADYFVFDWQSKFLSPLLVPDPDIIVIAIDDNSLTQMNAYTGKWVWPRSVHAELIDALLKLPIQSLSFDILFAESDIYRPDADQYLNDVLAQTNNVYFAMLQQDTRSDSGLYLSEYPQEVGIISPKHPTDSPRASFVLPRAIKQNNWQIGLINFSPEFDGVGRQYYVEKNIAGWKIPSLAAKVISATHDISNVSEQILLQWRGDLIEPFKTLSYVDVYRAIVENDINYLSQLIDKTIIVGTTASGLFDARATPINNQLAGVYMLATAFDNLKNHRYLTLYSTYLSELLTVFLLVIVSIIFFYFQRYSAQLAVSGALILLSTIFMGYISIQFLLEQHVLFIGSTLVFIFCHFALLAFGHGYSQYQQRHQAIALFGRFLDPLIINQLLSQGKLAPERLNKKQVVTVLFSDIRNFTQLSENNDAQDIVTLLNGYFNRQVSVIFKHKGTLDKFIGDCIMAFWGAPLNNKDHAIDAINAALEMEEQLVQFKQTLPKNLQQFEIGIGIHSGEALVGMVGADLRIDYTVIGDAVNLASRIEGVTKSIALNNGKILISEQTKILAQAAFDFEFIGEVEVKGRASKVKLYQPIKKVNKV